uniref:Uncharacterized protein n=1 Tax=Arundo donax TaxID=35708 RepID=A0A0A9B1N7_ARUDO
MPGAKFPWFSAGVAAG